MAEGDQGRADVVTGYGFADGDTGHGLADGVVTARVVADSVVVEGVVVEGVVAARDPLPAELPGRELHRVDDEVVHRQWSIVG